MSSRECKKILGLTLLATVAAVAFLTATAESAHANERAEQYLLICAADQARKAPDFLAVIDFTERHSGLLEDILESTAQRPQCQV